MPAKARGRGANLREIDTFDGGTGWMAHPEELMLRASHALVDGDEVWVVDPVDAEGLDDLLARYGTVAGVVVLFSWHVRDAGTLAARHEVPVYVPSWVTGIAGGGDAPVERFDDELADTGYRALRITPHPLWREAALYREADGTLVVPDSVGTAPYFRAPGERLGVSPYQRPWPPRAALGGLDPDRVLVGHGTGVFDDAAAALADALDGARRRAPAALATNVTRWPRTLAAALRD